MTMLPESRAVRIIAFAVGAAITAVVGVVWAKRWLGEEWSLGKVTDDQDLPEVSTTLVEEYFALLSSMGPDLVLQGRMEEYRRKNPFLFKDVR